MLTLIARRPILLLLLLLVCVAAALGTRSLDSVMAQHSSSAVSPLLAGDWPMYGHDLRRTNYNPAETTISTANVTQLIPRWQVPLGYGAIPDLSNFPSSSAPVVAA